MENRSVKIEVRGQGINIWAHAISNKTYQKLSKVDDPLSLVQEESIGSELVTWGINCGGPSKHNISVIGDDFRFDIENVVNADFREEFLELAQGWGLDPNKCIENRISDQVSLGTEIKSLLGKKRGKAYLFETTSYTDICLSATIPINEKFELADLRLLCNDMDSPTELCEICLEHGILSSLDEGDESALLGVIYKDRRYHFDCQAEGGSDSNLTLITRIPGGWFNDFVPLMQIS